VTTGGLEFSREEIKTALRNLKNKKSAGADEIPMCLIKDCSDLITDHLCSIFNYSVRPNWFPDQEASKDYSYPKKGSKVKVENYRPVSGLSTISKVFERCLLARLEGYERSDVTQHGFRANHGTVTAGLEVQHYVSSSLDSKNHVVVNSIDISTAFDLIRPELLDLSFVSRELELRNFLSDRKAYVDIGDECSYIKKLGAGIPQGSVLGPKMFTMYMSGLPGVLLSDSVNMVVYADDSYMISTADSRDELISLTELIMSKHVEWLRNVAMIVNATKTEMVYFMSDELLKITLDGSTITSSELMNVLGVTFDCQMS